MSSRAAMAARVMSKADELRKSQKLHERRRYCRLLSHLWRRQFRHAEDTMHRVFARELYDGFTAGEKNMFFDRYELEGKVLGDWLYDFNIEIGAVQMPSNKPNDADMGD